MALVATLHCRLRVRLSVAPARAVRAVCDFHTRVDKFFPGSCWTPGSDKLRTMEARSADEAEEIRDVRRLIIADRATVRRLGLAPWTHIARARLPVVAGSDWPTGKGASC